MLFTDEVLYLTIPDFPPLEQRDGCVNALGSEISMANVMIGQPSYPCGVPQHPTAIKLQTTRLIFASNTFLYFQP